MNFTIPIPILVALIAVAGIFVIYRLVRSVVAAIDANRLALAANTDAFNRLAAVTEQLRSTLAPAADELAKHMTAVPKLLEVIAKVGNAQFEILQQQRADAGNMPPQQRNRTPPTRGDVSSANMEYEVNQLMRAEGVSREEALMRLNGANGDSAWGSSLLDGWGR
jgi:hypothetical protein